jgi:hypothetical protein
MVPIRGNISKSIVQELLKAAGGTNQLKNLKEKTVS